MAQMLHNTKQFSRPVDSTRIDLAAAVLCGSCLKGNEWYEVSGEGVEDMKEVDE